jgi:hypothetical protein
MLKRFVVTSTGIDESLQGYGGDAFFNRAAIGLRVPTLATSWAGNITNATGRYLFNLVSFSTPANSCGRIRGWRKLLTIGFDAAPTGAGSHRFVELEVVTPNWRFPDGNVSWHLMDAGPPNATGIPEVGKGPSDFDNVSFRISLSSAMVYETITLPAKSTNYVSLTQYAPPNGGKPYGLPLSAGIGGDMLTQETSWRDPNAWNSLDIPWEGARTVFGYASVRQTSPTTRMALPAPAAFFSNGLPPEEQFLLTFPTAPIVYWRVGMQLICEVER